ncbi:hypothetical protein OHB26_21065 [Nocardia sp. NBC_01503]|uniref:hypothetical protein n=1 Tax=Nocardia sp. NBC_01503 TaxID=2975997 RepID=UPI002E7B444E|nr:hypothetical protein [Nocardia sp. NBC_01503]WTL29491.1 hypothetical protein OHB26_21065 [Nocardia sp. NBC_01503]
MQPWETRLEELTAQQYALSFDSLAKAASFVGKGARAAYKLANRSKKAGRAHVTRVDYGSPGPWRHSSNFDEPGTVPHGPLWFFLNRETNWG